jgi:quercetin dioxygenase-like cupin family protein/alkylhydroperoxidase/carboxymuconolactone decarboxylase family protein YurZ
MPVNQYDLKMKKIAFLAGVVMLLLNMSTYINAQNNMHVNSLDKKQEKIITIAAFTAKGDLDKLKPELTAGLDAGLTVNEIKEVLVQLYAYCGFPRSLRGLQTFMTVLDERKTNGINDNWGRKASPITDNCDKYERGQEILSKLSGTKAPEGKPQTGYAAFSPEIDTFLKEHLFADIFERDVLTYGQRELVTVSTLISIGGVEPMLTAHMGLCLNVGITPEQLKDLISIVEYKVDKNSANSAKAVLNELIQSKGLNVGKMQIDSLTKSQGDRIFPKGMMIKNEYFSGTAWLQMLLNANENHDISIANVVFEPGVRNNWHSHPAGQILICIKGKGYYQEKGKSIQLLNVGDVVDISPNVIHWHGATPDGEFEHIAINPQVHKGSVVWLQPVTNEEYNSYKK